MATKNTLTQKSALANVLENFGDQMEAEVREIITHMHEVMNKKRTSERTKSSADLQREARAREVAAIINEGGKPVTSKWLAANVDGWNINPETGKVTPQSISGCMNTAQRLGLIKSDKKGENGATRYMPLDYAVPEDDTLDA